MPRRYGILTALAILSILLISGYSTSVHAETNCDFNTPHANDTCDGACPQAKCIDFYDMNPTGDHFFCCPPDPVPEVPELPAWFGPFTLATIFIFAMEFFRRRRMAAALERKKSSRD